MKKIIIIFGIMLLFTGCSKNIETDYKKEISKEEFNIRFGEVYKSNNIEIEAEKIYLSEKNKNLEIENIIKNYLEYSSYFGDLRYLYNYIDLNDDGREEILVYLLGDYVSGTGGSTMIIINSESMEIMEEFTLINNPIMISAEKTEGFKNIIVPVYGGGEKLHFVQLKYDGKNYESNPSVVEEYYKDRKFKGEILIGNEILPKTGIYIEE